MKVSSFERRKQRERYRLAQVNKTRMRLTVYRSNKNIYAQIIDDKEGKTIASASTIDKTIKSSQNQRCNIEAAKSIGKLIAERAKEKGVSSVYFDRGAYLYHGKIKALADAARESGLEF